MKKSFKLVLTLFVIAMLEAAMLFAFAGCATQEEKAAVGRYNLISISGIPGVTVSLYEYSYVELKSNKNYHLENKVGTAVTEQDGKWSLKGEKLTFKRTIIGASSTTEEYTLKDDIITITGPFPYNGTTYNLTIKFKKNA